MVSADRADVMIEITSLVAQSEATRTGEPRAVYHGAGAWQVTAPGASVLTGAVLVATFEPGKGGPR